MRLLLSQLRLPLHRHLLRRRPLHLQPPLLQAPASAPVPANRAVDGEAHGSGEPALAPTPTPDDVLPPDAGGGTANSLPSVPASASASP